METVEENKKVFTTWQKGKMIKFKLKESDIKIVKIPYITITEQKKTRKHFVDTKNYTCECGQVELLGFIEKLNGKCRGCAGFIKK